MKSQSPTHDLRVAWTTTETRESADQFAREVIGSKLAACVQIDGEIQSCYPWKGQTKVATEIRIWIKYPGRNESELQQLVARIHPYETPQWISVDAATVGGAYFSWADKETK